MYCFATGQQAMFFRENEAAERHQRSGVGEGKLRRTEKEK